MKLYLVVCAACLISGAVIGYLNGKYAAGARFADTCAAHCHLNTKALFLSNVSTRHNALLYRWRRLQPARQVATHNAYNAMNRNISRS